jgi:phosphoribosylformylglycinamidine (FGAM) synthase-like amidotransferase family enzyme
VTNVSVQYDRTSQTITCTSTGGPATDVTWSKDDVNISLSIASNEGLYEYSQIIINTTSATYENRLRIVDKSSEAAGNYTCKVTNPRGSMNESLYIQGIKNSCKLIMLSKIP